MENTQPKWKTAEEAVNKAALAIVHAGHDSDAAREALRKLNRIFKTEARAQARFYALPNGDLAIFTQKTIEEFPITSMACLYAGYIEQTFDDGTAMILKAHDYTLQGLRLPKSTEPKEEYAI